MDEQVNERGDGEVCRGKILGKHVCVQAKDGRWFVLLVVS